MSERIYACKHPTLGVWRCCESQLMKSDWKCPVHDVPIDPVTLRVKETQ